MIVLVPNWNNPFRGCRFYKSLSGLKNYCKNNLICLSEVKDLKDINYYVRKHHLEYKDIDRVFVGF